MTDYQNNGFTCSASDICSGEMVFFVWRLQISLASDDTRWINSATKEQINRLAIRDDVLKGILKIFWEKIDVDHRPVQQLSISSLASLETRMLGTISLIILLTAAV